MESEDKIERAPPISQTEVNGDCKEPAKPAAPQELKNQKWTFYLAYCTFTIITCSSVMLGFNMGVINAPYAVMSIYVNESFQRVGTTLDKEELNTWWSVVVSLNLIGGFVGSLWFPTVLAGAIGKRNGLIVSSAIGAVGAFCSFITPWTNSYIPLLVGRAVVGVAVGLSVVIGTPLVNEHSPAILRGDLGGHYGNGSPAGLFFSNILGITYILGKTATWQFLFLIVGGVYLVSIVALLFVVDSPKDLVVRKKDEEAITALMKLRNLSREDVMPEYDQIKKAIESESTQASTSIKAVFSYRPHWWTLIIICTIHITNQLSGMGAAYYYTTKTLVEAGLTVETAALANLGISFATLVGNWIACAIIDSVGRRFIQLAGLALLIGSNVMLCVCIVCNQPNAAAVGFALLLFAFGLGPCPITYAMTPELPMRAAKTMAMSVGMVTNLGFRIAVSFVFPVMAMRIGGYSFLPFAGFCTFFFIFDLFCLPETSARLTDYDPEDFAKSGSLWQLKRPQKKKQQDAELAQLPNGTADKPKDTELPATSRF